MKFVKILILTLAVVAGTSCTLDLRDNPNAVQPNQVLPSLVIHGMQLNLANMFQPASTIGMQLTRLQNGGAAQYDRTVTPEGMNGIWTNAYANILVEANALIPAAEAVGYARHAGMARVMAAYTLIMLVDFFGDVPFSEAFNGSANFNPKLDDAQDVYNTALAMLDQAKLDLTTNTTVQIPAGYQNPVAPPITDMYYNNNFNSWVRLANTLKLKIYLNTKNEAEINNLINDVSSTGGFIDTQARNFVFRYGLSSAAPDSRHPRFIANYPAGGGNYMSNWLIWHMYHGYDAKSTGLTVGQGDPRIRFYFYRQVTTNSSNAEQIRCVGESVPSHYPISTGTSIIVNTQAGMPPMGVAPAHPTNDPTDPAWGRTFCYPTNVGYWGRDHVDNQGIPPDGLLRTAWGVYPSGGRFDNSAGASVSATQGQRGAGFQPLMMRSFVQFMLAEAKLTLPGVTAGLTARQYFENGIRQSMQDVRDWAVNGTYGTTAVAASPTEATVINSFYPNSYLGTFTTPVVAATTTNIPSLSGNLTVDGVSLVDGDRILVKNQTNATQNGIYIVASGSWTRATDADSPSELNNQAVSVNAGSVNGGSTWFQSTVSPVIGTNNVVYVGNSSYTVDVNNYVVSALAAFDNSAADAENYNAREFWIACFGNGVEAYNLYRRTGKPTGMQPTLNPTPGAFPRSTWYPANAANLNNQINQKASVGERIFWDTNTTNLDF